MSLKNLATTLLICVSACLSISAQASLQSEYKVVCTPNADGAVYNFYFNTLSFVGEVSEDGQYAYSSARVSIGLSDSVENNNLKYTDESATLSIRSPFKPRLVGVITNQPNGDQITFFEDESGKGHNMFHRDASGKVKTVSAECSVSITHLQNKTVR